MSHLVKKTCALRDLQTLLKAAETIGWTVQQGGKAGFFSGYSDECDYVLTPVGELNDRGEGLKYTIGITQDQTGTISLHYDNAMNSRDVLYGDEEDSCTKRILGKLKQSYQSVATQQFARNQRWSSKVQTLENGKVGVKMRVG